jgi:hypothetical protein
MSRCPARRQPPRLCEQEEVGLPHVGAAPVCAPAIHRGEGYAKRLQECTIERPALPIREHLHRPQRQRGEVPDWPREWEEQLRDEPKIDPSQRGWHREVRNWHPRWFIIPRDRLRYGARGSVAEGDIGPRDPYRDVMSVPIAKISVQWEGEGMLSIADACPFEIWTEHICCSFCQECLAIANLDLKVRVRVVRVPCPPGDIRGIRDILCPKQRFTRR